MTDDKPHYYEPHDLEPVEAWDEGEPEDRPDVRIVWGRVAALVVACLVAFLLGRSTAPAGVSQARLDTALQERDDARDEVEQLQSELQSLPEEQATEQPSGSGDGGQAEDQIYVVEKGDTLTTIAEEFYGDPSLDDYLAEYNDIVDPTTLHVGQEIRIPPEPPQ